MGTDFKCEPPVLGNVLILVHAPHAQVSESNSMAFHSRDEIFALRERSDMKYLLELLHRLEVLDSEKTEDLRFIFWSCC